MKYIIPVIIGLTLGAGLVIGFKIIKVRRASLKSSISQDILYGVNISAFSLKLGSESYKPSTFAKQLPVLRELGVHSVRLNLEMNKSNTGGQPLNEVNDDTVATLLKQRVKILLVVEDPFSDRDLFRLGSYEAGRRWGSQVASRYKGKIYAYQLANEVSGMVIKPNYPGLKIADYDPTQYEVLKNWLKGLADGIHESDPSALRVIAAHWLGIGIIDQLMKDGVPFEVIGWNWFSDMGDDPTHKILPDGTVLNIPEYFAKSGKKFWFTELNRDHGSSGQNGLSGQAQYLESVINRIQQSSYVSGIFIHTLLDDPFIIDEPSHHWGLVVVAKDAHGSYQIGQYKPAFYTFQKFTK